MGAAAAAPPLARSVCPSPAFPAPLPACCCPPALPQHAQGGPGQCWLLLAAQACCWLLLGHPHTHQHTSSTTSSPGQPGRALAWQQHHTSTAPPPAHQLTTSSPPAQQLSSSTAPTHHQHSSSAPAPAQHQLTTSTAPAQLHHTSTPPARHHSSTPPPAAHQHTTTWLAALQDAGWLEDELEGCSLTSGWWGRLGRWLGAHSEGDTCSECVVHSWPGLVCASPPHTHTHTTQPPASSPAQPAAHQLLPACLASTSPSLHTGWGGGQGSTS